MLWIAQHLLDALCIERIEDGSAFIVYIYNLLTNLLPGSHPPDQRLVCDGVAKVGDGLQDLNDVLWQEVLVAQLICYAIQIFPLSFPLPKGFLIFPFMDP